MIDKQTISPAQLKRLKVLVIDPNAFMRGLVADSLRRLTVTNISAAASAAEGLATARSFRPDIVFVEWNAGRISGPEFTEAIRRGSAGIARETPIVLLAATIDHDQLGAALQAGVSEFLLKPISAQHLLARVEEVVLRPRNFIESQSFVGPCRRRREERAFAGPWRRLTDAPRARAATMRLSENAPRLRAIIHSLAAYAGSAHEDRSAGIRGLYRLLRDRSGEVGALGDEAIMRVWNAALHYVEGVGMTDAYEAEVLERHFQTVIGILDMPEEDGLHRDERVSDLERLVAGKIRAP